MPFSSVKEAKSRVKALKNKSAKEVKVFIRVFNNLVSKGEDEDSAIPKAIASANKVNKSMLDERFIKNTNNDFRRLIQDEVSSMFGNSYALDHDEEYVYFERWDNDSNKYITYRVSYETQETGISLGDIPEEVVQMTDFKVIAKSQDYEAPEKTFLDKVVGVMDKYFGNGVENTTKPLIKQFDDEEMIAVEPLYISLYEVDGQGDTIEDIDVIYRAVDSFNKANEEGILQSSLFHKHKTESFNIIKAWVNECECYIGDHYIPEGQPIAKVQFNSKEAWELRKSGELTGLSIGARGIVEEVKD